MATGIQKQSFKFIEVPLNKFNEEAIPHHQQIFDQHKITIHKLILNNKTEELKKEIKDKKRVIRQLKDLSYELDSLRAQVNDSDLDKFDEKTISLRRTITAFIKEYGGLEKLAAQLIESQNEINENIENENPFQGVPQIQIQADLSELKLQEHSERLKKVQALETDVEDLHDIYIDLNKMVVDQAEGVDTIENNVEDTKQDVDAGLKHLIAASKYKTAAYPVTGALIGSLVGGPIGLVAGLKVGGIAAIGCGLVGYTSGKMFKKCNETEIANSENVIKTKEEEDAAAKEDVGVGDKKDK